MAKNLLASFYWNFSCLAIGLVDAPNFQWPFLNFPSENEDFTLKSEFMKLYYETVRTTQLVPRIVQHPILHWPYPSIKSRPNFFKYETIVRSSAWSFDHSDPDLSSVFYLTE